MRSFLIFFLIFFMGVLPACKGEDDNYAGVGKLIADRNKMRYHLAEESGNNEGKAELLNENNNSVPKDVSKKVTHKKELSTNVLDETKIVIVDSSSGAPLGQGIAYVDKKGEIVKIKLAK